MIQLFVNLNSTLKNYIPHDIFIIHFASVDLFKILSKPFLVNSRNAKNMFLRLSHNEKDDDCEI